MDFMNGKIIRTTEDRGRGCLVSDTSKNIYLMSAEEFEAFLADPVGAAGNKKVWDKERKEMVKIEDIEENYDEEI